ncbi:MAG: AAA family ATPase [Bryobacteraceae bacterium]
MHIKRLIITNYRGLDSLTWDPSPRMNCLIGPGDTGKSTVLSAVGLLLAPYPVQQASEFGYYRRRVQTGFTIEAYVGGIDGAGLSTSAAATRGSDEERRLMGCLHQHTSNG